MTNSDDKIIKEGVDVGNEHTNVSAADNQKLSTPVDMPESDLTSAVSDLDKGQDQTDLLVESADIETVFLEEKTEDVSLTDRNEADNVDDDLFKETVETDYTDVEKTIEEIEKEKKQARKRKSFFYYLFFPFVKFYELIKRLTNTVKITLAVKTTIIFALMLLVIIIAITVYLIGTFQKKLSDLGVDYEVFIRSLSWGAAALIVIGAVLVVALGIIFVQLMLKPLRRMTEQIDDITSENLYERLDDVDAQDELKELTKRINKMLDEIEGSFNRQKMFVSDASHELKTPIAVIRGYSDMLKRWGKDDPNLLTEGIESISKEAENMQRIVEQLLFLVKLGRYMLSYTDFDISAEIISIAEGYSLVHPKREFAFKGKKSLPVSLDKNMTIECIRAIADNAIKYSEDGTAVKFGLLYEEDAEFFVLEITDNGLGISQEDQDKIFDRFYRCDRARVRDKNSSGLGLTIAKSIIEMMGGDIKLKSELKKGSTFSITLPVSGKRSNV